MTEENLPENNNPDPTFIDALKPIIEKVGVPLLWVGVGYLVAVIMRRKT
ncbi:unnamed protein product [marine sediment metagenome]|uniref:Uncharacterized protein n=1 Tax=marine sediment metagenome TaxID=412755 RepID=X1G018_9ZZZZ